MPIDADDLPDWAVRLYDEYLRRPDLIRLATWTRLERRPAGHLVETHQHYDDRKLTAIAEAQAAGRVRPGDPFDLMALVIAMSMAWSPVSNVYAANNQEPDDVHDQRRALLRDCVRRATVPSDKDRPGPLTTARPSVASRSGLTTVRRGATVSWMVEAIPTRSRASRRRRRAVVPVGAALGVPVLWCCRRPSRGGSSAQSTEAQLDRDLAGERWPGGGLPAVGSGSRHDCAYWRSRPGRSMRRRRILAWTVPNGPIRYAFVDPPASASYPGEPDLSANAGLDGGSLPWAGPRRGWRRPAHRIAGTAGLLAGVRPCSGWVA